MPRKLDPAIGKVLKEYGEGEDACWDCHGVWVVYHKALERVAAKAGIVFDMPQVLECDSIKKTVALCVNGTLGERSEWSIGEAAPQNNKNSYPYAMAEKRAKDRVILKLVGLHGLAYSEEEADDFKYSADGNTPADLTPEADQRMADNIGKVLSKGVADLPRNEQEWKAQVAKFATAINACNTVGAVDKLVDAATWIKHIPSQKTKAYVDDLIQGRREILETPVEQTAISGG